VKGVCGTYLTHSFCKALFARLDHDPVPAQNSPYLDAPYLRELFLLPKEEICVFLRSFGAYIQTGVRGDAVG
jgi:hypothetical protein